MRNKVFYDETFTIVDLETDLDELTEKDPKVNQIVLKTDNENVSVITHNPTKKAEERRPKTDPSSGIEFPNSKSDKKVQKTLSELPDHIKKIQAALNEYDEVKVTGDVSRWTSDDGERSGFYLSEDQVNELEFHIEDATDYADEEDDDSEDEDDENPFE